MVKLRRKRKGISLASVTTQSLLVIFVLLRVSLGHFSSLLSVLVLLSLFFPFSLILFSFHLHCNVFISCHSPHPPSFHSIVWLWRASVSKKRSPCSKLLDLLFYNLQAWSGHTYMESGHFLNTYHVPAAAGSALYILSHLSSVNLWSWYYHWPYFMKLK